ncbi:hypothetical protein [Glycomyces tritici]|uniref:DUF2637 domain-containing protein n=1 Tax=Glycomyces tritici TaxID=2665176 RepID=A0ABT7YQB6_9ACTN|nr:hypothetical protein [Glycomyces tritici]MDN3240849.1 hypothetical protein [Glycomyces tritici]
MTTFIETRVEAPAFAAAVPAPAAPNTDRMTARPSAEAAWWLVLGETPGHAAITGVFYAVCLIAAVFGQSLVGTAVLGLALWFALTLACALELAGVKFAYDAAVARAAGEHAIVPQALSYVLAAIAVGVNIFGHLVMGDAFGAAVFGLFSALAFIAFTIRAEFRRRQADRAAGKAAHPTPAYGLTRWVTQRAVTKRAKALAAADPTLGLYGSLAAAETAIAAEARRAEIAGLLRRKALADFNGDKLRASLYVAQYDLDRIAAELCEQADHGAAVADIAADLNAERTAPARTTPTAETAAPAPAPKPRRARTSTAKAKRTNTADDAALVARLRALAAETGTAVSINRARTEFRIGTPRATRLVGLAADAAYTLPAEIPATD